MIWFLFNFRGRVRDMMEGELLMPSVDQEHNPVSHYKRRSIDSDGVQVQQLISPTKNTSSSRDHPETKPRIASTSINSIKTMSYPENQQPANGAAQTNGSGSANPGTQPSASPSSPAIQRWMGERPWEEPFHAQGSGSGTSSTANSGASTQTEKRS